MGQMDCEASLLALPYLYSCFTGSSELEGPVDTVSLLAKPGNIRDETNSKKGPSRWHHFIWIYRLFSVTINRATSMKKDKTTRVRWYRWPQEVEEVRVSWLLVTFSDPKRESEHSTFELHNACWWEIHSSWYNKIARDIANITRYYFSLSLQSMI